MCIVRCIVCLERMGSVFGRLRYIGYMCVFIGVLNDVGYLVCGFVFDCFLYELK